MLPPASCLPTNEYRFVCPALAQTVRYRDCLKLDEMTMKGGFFVETAGCQACMASSKCIARVMRKEEFRENAALYYSEQSSAKAPSVETQRAIRSIIIQESHIRQNQVDGDDLAALRSANQNVVPSVADPKILPKVESRGERLLDFETLTPRRCAPIVVGEGATSVNRESRQIRRKIDFVNSAPVNNGSLFEQAVGHDYATAINNAMTNLNLENV